jgi:hypothetical protein
MWVAGTMMDVYGSWWEKRFCKTNGLFFLTVINSSFLKPRLEWYPCGLLVNWANILIFKAFNAESFLRDFHYFVQTYIWFHSNRCKELTLRIVPYR